MKAIIIKWNGSNFVSWEFDSVRQARQSLKKDAYYKDINNVRYFAADCKSQEYLFNK